jgi:MFS family permease
MVQKLILFGFLLSNLASSFDISSCDARRQHKTNGLMHSQPNSYFGCHCRFDVPAIRQRPTCLSAISDHESLEDVAVGPQNVVDPLVSLLIAQFLLFIGVGAVIPSIPLYGKELGFSSAANGLVISIPAVAMLILSKVGGKYADQGRKPAMNFGMAWIALSDLGTALATSLPMLIVARLGLGAGRCISESGERGMLADLANQMPQRRGRALAAQQACAALGIAIGAPLGGIVVEEYGPRAAFLCVSVAATIAMIIYCFLPETMNCSEKLIDEMPASKVSDSLSLADKADWGRLLSQKQWRGIAICQSGASFGFGAKIAAIPLLAASHLPAEPLLPDH